MTDHVSGAGIPEPGTLKTTIHIIGIDCVFSHVGTDINGQEVYAGGARTIQPPTQSINEAIKLLEALRDRNKVSGN